ncbi:MAG: hypothetical protein PHE83_16645 [Opitutaceae bacterium]|nr:hypothetical protein [Opitutaceae bacterium]
MSAVILDTNIYLRATALEMADAEAVFLNSSRHDRESSPEEQDARNSRHAFGAPGMAGPSGCSRHWLNPPQAQ